MIKVLLKPADSDDQITLALERRSGDSPSGYAYRCGERHGEVEIETVGPGRGWVRLRGSVVPFFAVRTDRHVDVWVGGKVYRIGVVDGGPQRVGSSIDAGTFRDLAAPMPGTVLQINVRPGDRFEAHQALMIVESMKMETTLSVPHGGRVKEITCKEGDLVAMGEILARLEGGDDSADDA